MLSRSIEDILTVLACTCFCRALAIYFLSASFLLSFALSNLASSSPNSSNEFSDCCEEEALLSDSEDLCLLAAGALFLVTLGGPEKDLPALVVLP